VSRYKFARWPGISPGAEICKTGTGAVAVQALWICLGSRSKSKNRDKLITPTIRVIVSAFLVLVQSRIVNYLTVMVCLFASSFKSFGCVSARGAFKCACKKI